MTCSEDYHNKSPLSLLIEENYDFLMNGRHIVFSFVENWGVQLVLALLLVAILLIKYTYATAISGIFNRHQANELPPTAPRQRPIIGHLVSFMFHTAHLASSITKQHGPSAVVRLTLLHREIYVVSGAEYLHALFKNTKGLTSVDGINTALHSMFATSKQDMKFWTSDNSGITHDPHPQSSVSAENRGHYITHKSIVHGLTGSHLTTAGQNFQAALQERIDAVSIHKEWVEMDDLYGFLLPLISESTLAAICGRKFLENFPDFTGNFWTFNRKMPQLIQGRPRWMMPRVWEARDRCLSIMKEWREVNDDMGSDINVLFQKRWRLFSETQRLSDDGVANSDLGILWAMTPSSVAASFWLIWHMIRDRGLLTEAASEVSASYIIDPNSQSQLDTSKLCNQPLLQSSFAEILRVYVAASFLRRPEFEDAQVLDYKIPRDKVMVVFSAMAHMDKRNWNLGSTGQHAVETFWAQRFLTSSNPNSGSPVTPSAMTDSPDYVSDKTAIAPKPKFSLSGYNSAWIPFGSGVHQCPGRHWVKLRMLVTFAMMQTSFDIELLTPNKTLKVDISKYGTGALPPGEKASFRIRRR